MTPQEAFHQFCEKHGIEPTDRDRTFWFAALLTTLNQEPVAYAPLDITSGIPLAVWSALNPGVSVRQVPLYRHPVAAINRPPLDQASAELVMRNYADDPVGLALFFHRYYTANP